MQLVGMCYWLKFELAPSLFSFGVSSFEMSMHTTQEWAQSSQFNMYQAQMAHRRAIEQLDRSARAHEDVFSDSLGMHHELHSSLEQKVKISQRLVEKLSLRAESLKNSLEHTKQSLEKLSDALVASEAPLALCTWRTEQREHRPLREQVRDGPEVSLQMERATLLEGQRQLREFIKKTKATIQALEVKREELEQDIEQKTQALSVDELCLRTTQRGLDKERGFLPRVAKGKRPAQAGRLEATFHESSRNEVLRQQEALRLNQAVMQREEAAKELREEGQRLIQQTLRAAEQAFAKTERSFKDRVSENKQLRRSLEQELRQMLTQIQATKSIMQSTRQHLRSLDEPMELTSTCASWRRTRAQSLDPVSATLQQHQMMLLQRAEELKQNQQHEHAVLHELQEKKEQLEDDLRDKSKALHIDLTCLTHGGKATQRLPRSFRLDSSLLSPLTAR